VGEGCAGPAWAILVDVGAEEVRGVFVLESGAFAFGGVAVGDAAGVERTLALHLLKPACQGGAWEGSSAGTTL